MENKTTEWMSGPAPTVCRCCLAEGCYKDISTEYFWMGKREVYAEMLSETFDLSIAYAQTGGPNSHSRLICEPCISRLRDASEFKKQVQECEKTFINHLDPCSTTVTVEIEPSDQVKLETVKEEQKHSDSEDFDDRLGFEDDDDDLDDQPLTKLASKPLKKEKADLLDLLDNSQAPVKRKSTLKAKAPPAKKAKLKIKEKAKPSPSKAPTKTPKKKKGTDPTIIPKTPKSIVPLFQVAYDRSLCKPLGTLVDFSKLGIKVKTLIDTSKIHSSAPRARSLSRSPSPFIMDSSDYPLKTEISVPSPLPLDVSTVAKTTRPKKIALKRPPDYRQNALTVFEFSTVYPFVYGNNSVKCFVCSQAFLETAFLRRHMNETHEFAPLKRLVNNRRENVLKVDVGELMCTLCLLLPKDLSELKHHLKEVHRKPIDPELKDNMIPFKLEKGDEGKYKCVMCDQTFLKIRILVIHMSVHFNNYSCEICGSGFMTLRLLKKHLEVHETGNFPCDRCDKIFNTTHKRSLHIRGVHLKQNPRRCPMCPERFNSNYRRTIHLQDVHNQSTRVHKCDQCGRAFNLKYHLVCHTRSVHLQERNQQCDVCHQRFCNKETLKRHMVIHTGEKKYKCEVCGMAFLRRKNLKDHLRLHEIV